MLRLYSFYMLTYAFLFLDMQVLGVLIHRDHIWIAIYSKMVWVQQLSFRIQDLCKGFHLYI